MPQLALSPNDLEYIFDMHILSWMQFEWDEDKALENAKKHRVSFEQAQQVFDDPHALPTIGLVSVSFTYHDDVVRLISARRAEKWMAKIYEDEK